MANSHIFGGKAGKRNFGIGQAIQPRRNLSRYVKWPRYVRLQRQRAILKKRLKVPPAVNHFAKTLDKNQATTLFRLLAQYRPETRKQKKERLLQQASNGGDVDVTNASTKPYFVKFGINHVTQLVEERKAKLVIIAHDVDPLELVLWLPALCRKMDVPYCIVKGKARLGHLIHQKTATALAITDVRKEHQGEFTRIVERLNIMYKDAAPDRKWGGGILGVKAQAAIHKKEKQIAREAARAQAAVF